MTSKLPRAINTLSCALKSPCNVNGLVADLDFSHMTLHQAKRAEMESQVRVLELEHDLDQERQRLSELRRTHYKMAGESEGWEQQVRV